MRRFLRLALLALPVLLLLLLAGVGLLSLVRGAPAVRIRVLGNPAGAPAVATADFPRTVTLLTGTPLADGNRVEVLADGVATYPRLWSDMRSARRSLTVQLYYITPGVLLDSLVQVLGERAAAGVDVRFLYDAVGAEVPDSARAALTAAGVRHAAFRPVRWYRLHQAQNRSHTRLVVVDGRVGYTGGFGIDDRWRGGGAEAGEWRDTNVRATGPAVAQLQAAFAAGWAEATGELLAGALYFEPAAAPPGADSVGSAETGAGRTTAADRVAPAAPIAPVPAVLAGVLHSVASPGNTAGQRLFALNVAAARERLWITNSYFVPTDEVVEMLSAAARRGVDVRLLLPGTRTDVPLTRWAARGRYPALLRAGVRVYEYQPTMLHAKTFVVDGAWSGIGTMNLDTRSFVHNDEVVLLAWDGEVARVLERLFLEDLRHARAIVPARFERRSWRERLLEGLARQLTKVL